MVNHEKPSSIWLAASGFCIPSLPPNLAAIPCGLLHDPSPVQHGKISGQVHVQRLQVDSRAHGERDTIPFTNGICSLHRSVAADKDCARLIQRDNRFQVMAIECVLKGSV